MVDWTKTTQKGFAGESCGTGLSTNINIYNPDGSLNQPNLDAWGNPTWVHILPNSTVEYELQTYAKGANEPGQDRFTITVWGENTIYLMQTAVNVYEGANSEEQRQWAAVIDTGEIPDDFSQEIMDTITPDRYMVIHKSMNHWTDNMGYKKGSFKLTNIPPSPISIVFEYGYSSKAESTQDIRYMKWIEAHLSLLVLVLLEVLIYVISVLIAPITGGGSVGIATIISIHLAALLLDEKIGLTHNIIDLMLNRYARIPVGDNRYGCSFDKAAGPWVHVYGGVYYPQIDHSGKDTAKDERQAIRNSIIAVVGSITTIALIGMMMGGDETE